MPALLADRAAAYVPSPARTVFDLHVDPDYLSLASGNPAVDMLPHDHLAGLSERIVAENRHDFLQYGASSGSPEVAELAAELMAPFAQVDARHIQVTAGASHALDLTAKLLVNPGDVVIVESPTFPTAMMIFRGYGAELREARHAADGLHPEAVAEAIDAAHSEGRRVALVYVVPSHQNPTGLSLSDADRDGFVAVCASRGVTIVEDDPYALLGFPGVEPLRSLYDRNPAHVIHVNSFSKIFSPGLRLGWLAGPREFRATAALASAATVLHPSRLAQELALAFVGSPHWEATVAVWRRTYAERAQALMDALTSSLPGTAQVTQPRGGFFTWLTLPGMEADLLQPLLDSHVLALPGNSCRVVPQATTQLRLAFTGETPDGLRRAATLIGAAVAARRDS